MLNLQWNAANEMYNFNILYKYVVYKITDMYVDFPPLKTYNK